MDAVHATIKQNKINDFGGIASYDSISDFNAQ